MFGLREDTPGWGLNSLYAAIAGLDRGSVPPLAQSTAAMSALFAATLLVKLRLNAVAARGVDAGADEHKGAGCSGSGSGSKKDE